MFKKNELDHTFILEVMGFALTLLGYKNNFGFINKNNNGTNLLQIDDHDKDNTTDTTINDNTPLKVKETGETKEEDI